MKKIFDCHIHCSDRSDDILIPYAKMSGVKYNLAELLSLMDKNDIFGGLLLSPPLSNGKPLPNPEVISLCNKSKGKLFPVLTVEPTKSSVRAATDLAKKNSGYVRAFKILLGYYDVYPDDEVFSKLYDRAEESGLPVMFHTGDTATPDGSLKHSHPLNIDALANVRPELKIVVCHFGNPWLHDTAELLYKHQNVYADISGMFAGGSKYSEKYLRFLSRSLSEAIYFVGSAEKILFGSDYPVENFADALRLAKSLDVDSDQIDKILAENARQIFSL
jgi:uncharacterized protein